MTHRAIATIGGWGHPCRSHRFRVNLLLYFACSGLGLSAPAMASDPWTPEKIAALTDVVDAYDRAERFSGVVLVAAGDRILLHEARGLANAEHRIPNKPSTVFRLASVTKMMTAAAVLRLVDQGKLELSDPVGRYVPALGREFGEKLTVHQLLSHRSGLLRNIEDASDKGLCDRFTVPEILELANSRPLRFEPGSRHEYSNVGYSICAVIIQALTGRIYADAMRELVFKPLNMTRTGHERPRAVIPDMASGYLRLPDGLVRPCHEDKSSVPGAGSLYSTAENVLRFSLAVRSAGFLSDRSRAAMFTSYEGDDWGYGWHTFEQTDPSGAQGRKGWEHDGSCPGFAAVHRAYSTGETIVLLANVRAGGSRPLGLREMVTALDAVMFGGEAPSVDDYSTDLDRIARIAIETGPQAAADAWAALPDAATRPAEAAVNRLAYDYYFARELERAIALNRFQTLVFPSANAYDSLGETYAMAGMFEEAAAAYRKAVAVDPTFANAQAKLRELSEKAPAGKDHNTASDP